MVDCKKNIVDVEMGKGVKIADFVNLYGCKIGDGTKIGTFVEIQRGATIGSNCKISSHSFICEGVTIGNGVFVGHNVSFINDRNPMAVNEDGCLKNKEEWTMEKTEIGNNVSIGTSATLMCGITVGQGAMIGAGALVLHDVPQNAIVVGNPARIIKYREQDE